MKEEKDDAENDRAENDSAHSSMLTIEPPLTKWSRPNPARCRVH